MSNSNWPPSYEEALKEVARRRLRGFATLVNPHQPEYPNLPLDSVGQAKVRMVGNLMLLIGRTPGDMPVDQSIIYNYLNIPTLDFLTNTLKIPAKRSFAPFEADYTAIFHGGKRLFDSKKTGIFYGQLVHIFVVEAQLTLTQQYYYGLGLDKDTTPLSVLSTILSDEEMNEIRLSDLSQIDGTDLHGRIFLEYYVIMIRAQWDKLIRLLCTAFDLKSNWDSISDGLGILEAKSSQITPSGKEHLDLLIKIAKERLDEKHGWLKPFRDNLVHKTAQHSAGVIAQTKSWETTNQLWNKAVQEHNWWREAMMVAIIVCAISKP